MTLSLTELATQSVQITADAAAFGGARPGCLLARDDGTCAQQAPDDRHAGEGRSSIKARLTSISVVTAT